MSNEGYSNLWKEVIRLNKENKELRTELKKLRDPLQKAQLESRAINAAVNNRKRLYQQLKGETADETNTRNSNSSGS